MAGNYFQGSPLIINTSNTLSGMQKADFVPNISMLKPRTDGRAVITLATIAKEAPVLDCATLNIAAALNLMTLTGELPYLVLTNLKWYGRKVDPNAPKFLGTSVHELGTALAGTMFFAGLESTANEAAILSLMCLMTSSDGSTHPVTWTQAAAPSDPTTIAPFFLDTVTIDGTSAEDEVISVSVQPTVDVQYEFGTKPYVRMARPRTVDWMMTIRHTNKLLIRSKGDKAGAIQATWKSANTGGPTRGSTVVTFTVTGAIVMGGDTGPGEGNGEVTTIVHGRHDGTNQPFTCTVV